MMVAISNLLVQYCNCPVQQTYEKILNSIVMVTKGLWVSLAIPYVAIRNMQNNGWCYGRNINIYLWLNYSVIVT